MKTKTGKKHIIELFFPVFYDIIFTVSEGGICMNEVSLTAEKLKALFEENRLRKYNLTYVFRFLEENIYECIINPSFDVVNYMEFIKAFDDCLNILKPNAKEILIEKYGLISGVPKTAVEISLNNKLSTNGVSTSVRNSIISLKNNGKVVKLRRFFNFQKKQSKNQKEENIAFVLNVLKELALTSLVGFDIVEVSNNKKVGTIVSIDDSTANILFELEDGRLIPATDDLITDINTKDRTIKMEIPEGLLEL